MVSSEDQVQRKRPRDAAAPKEVAQCLLSQKDFRVGLGHEVQQVSADLWLLAFSRNSESGAIGTLGAQFLS